MDLQDALRMMGWGAYFYLHKPLDPWPIIERLVDNAIRFHRNQRAVERARKKEVEIARLLRTYIVETSTAPVSRPCTVGALPLNGMYCTSMPASRLNR